MSDWPGWVHLMPRPCTADMPEVAAYAAQIFLRRVTSETGDLVISFQVLGGFGAPCIQGYGESHVPPETITELVAFAKAGQRENFDFLAGSAGVPAEDRDALWAGTLRRLGRE